MLLDLSRIRTGTEHLERRYELPVPAATAEAFRLVAPAELVADVHKDERKVRLTGRVRATLEVDCSRCLEEASAHVSDEAHIIFAETGDEETDDPDVYRLDPSAQELDLRPALREEWLLAAPTFAVCREDCKGLCPKCGADLNAGPHDCSQSEADPRWDALRKLGQSR